MANPKVRYMRNSYGNIIGFCKCLVSLERYRIVMNPCSHVLCFKCFYETQSKDYIKKLNLTPEEFSRMDVLQINQYFKTVDRGCPLCSHVIMHCKFMRFEKDM